MDTFKTVLFFWNDWIIGAVALCGGIAFWFATRRPSALVVAIGVSFMCLSTVMGAVFASTPVGDPLSYYYGGASEAIGFLGAGLLVIGLAWYLIYDQKTVRTRILALKKHHSISASH